MRTYSVFLPSYVFLLEIIKIFFRNTPSPFFLFEWQIADSFHFKFFFHTLTTHLAPIYFSSDSSESSEKNSSLSVKCLTSFFFQCIYILLKTLPDSNFYLF